MIFERDFVFLKVQGTVLQIFHDKTNLGINILDDQSVMLKYDKINKFHEILLRLHSWSSETLFNKTIVNFTLKRKGCIKLNCWSLKILLYKIIWDGGLYICFIHIPTSEANAHLYLTQIVGLGLLFCHRLCIVMFQGRCEGSEAGLLDVCSLPDLVPYLGMSLNIL